LEYGTFRVSTEQVLSELAKYNLALAAVRKSDDLKLAVSQQMIIYFSMDLLGPQGGLCFKKLVSEVRS